MDNIFQDELVPTGTLLAGYAYLVKSCDLQSYIRFPSVISQGHVRGTSVLKANWQIYDKRYWPGETAINHLVFALKHEPFNLLTLKCFFDIFPKKEQEHYIISKPTGIYARKIGAIYCRRFKS